MLKLDKTINMTLRMTKIKGEVIKEVLEAEECEVAVDLFWQDLITEKFNIKSDITEYVEDTGGPG